jgi:sugar lactone lactonase YvrE
MNAMTETTTRTEPPQEAAHRIPASELSVVTDGLTFVETPRWHEGRLWFSEFFEPRVLAMSEDGSLETIVRVPNQPAGLGWLPDGRLLVVSMKDRKVMRLDGDELVEHADISHLASWHANDMIVDRHGRAYVGNWGFDVHSGAPFSTAILARVDPDGSTHAAEEGTSFPNGMAIIDDGRTLLLSESRRRWISAFDIAEDGSLSNKRVWAKLPGVRPDGIAVDTAGGVWVADAEGHRVLRVVEGGEWTHQIDLGDRQAYACALGGADGRTLYLCSAHSFAEEECVERMSGAILSLRVEHPALPHSA